MKIPLIDLSHQHQKIYRQTRRALDEVMRSQRFILNEKVKRFETEAAEYLGAKFAVGLASGSDALYLSLLGLGVGPGDEVITTPFSFFATAGAISRTGAKPVFADIDRRTLNLDPSQIVKKITKRTKAVLPVHLFGLACDMDAIRSIARQRSLFVVEDAAQSFGAEYKGKKTGAIGDAGCFSFYPTKNLGGAGDGGMIATSNKTLADRVRILRDHGQSKKYVHEQMGINSRLDELQAAFLSVKLKYVDAWNRKRREHALFYNEHFADLPMALPGGPIHAASIYHLYSVLTGRRDALSDFLTQKGIGNSVYYPLPLHRQPCYRKLGYRRGDLRVSEEVSGKILSLPMYPELSVGGRMKVVRAVREFFGKK